MTDQNDELLTEGIFLRVEPKLKTALERLARGDRRSLANYLRCVAERHVRDAEKKAAVAA
jgi:hypothetical protein